MFREAEVTKKVSEKRALLFNMVNDVKAWKSNELNFYDQRLDQLKILRMKLERCQTKIITNVNMLSRKVSENADLEENSKRKRKRSQENARKTVARKERRLLSTVCETTKILTNGKREYKSLQSGSVQIKREDFCQEPNRKPRYHLDALRYLIEKDLIA